MCASSSNRANVFVCQWERSYWRVRGMSVQYPVSGSLLCRSAHKGGILIRSSNRITH